MLVTDLYKDNYLKFEHSEVINSIADDLDAIGATNSAEIRSLAIVPDDTNSIFVAKTGNDSTGTGTQANPYKTVKFASTQVTASKQYVVIDDSETYEESQLTMTGNFVGLISSMGNNPTIQPATSPDQFDLNAVINDYELNTQDVFPVDEYTYSGSQVRLSNGNYAVYYTKRLTSDNDNSKDFEVRCKIFNDTFTTTISDTKLFDITAQDLYLNLTGSFSVISRPAVLKDRFVFLMYKTVYQSTSSDWKIVVNNDGTLYSQTQYGSGGYVYYWLNAVKDNIYTIIEQNQSPAQRAFYVYDSGTLKYSTTAASSKNIHHLYSDDTYLYFSIATIGGSCDFIKMTLADYTTATTTISGDSAKWWYTGGSTSKVKVFKSGTQYFIFFDVAAGSFSIQEYNMSTYLPVNSAKSLTNIISGKAYNYTVSDTFYVNSIHHLNDTLLLVNFVSSTNMIFNVLDMSKFNSGTPSDYTCYQSQTCVPNYNQYTFASWNYTLNSSYQLSILTAGKQLRIFDMAMVKSSVSSIINGIVFDADNTSYVRNIIKSTAALDVRYCTFRNIYNTTSTAIDKFDSYIVTGTGASTIRNNYTTDTCMGFRITNNTADFQRNAVIRCTEGNAIEITGTGTGIVFNHNTLYDNYAGLEIKSNGGTEVVKNSIFYNNGSFGVKVATTLAVKNSVCTDALVVATLDSTSKNLNPLFWDEGVENPEQTDLHIQSRVAGYQLNSPALAIADDTFDAGCYKVEYTIAPPSYTSFLMIKPKKIGVNYSPVNFVEVTMQDGTYDTSFDGFQQEITLDYETIAAKYLPGLLQMYLKGGEVRLYLNPSSDPFLFETVKLSYKDLNLDSEFFKLNQYGVKGVKLIFIRKFSVEELS